MKEFFKKIFLKKSKRTFFYSRLVLLIILGLLIPLKSSQAVAFLGIPLVYWIGGALLGFIGLLKVSKAAAALTGNLLIAIILFIPLLLGNLFFGLAASFLDGVTSPNFISISYTKADNPVIAVGWPLLRDFANIFIVLGLLVIGLATILRIEEYRAQKTLPKLILVALLVNFSLVICGFIIDISNTVTYNLLEGLTGWKAFLGFLQKSGDIYSLDNIIDKWNTGTFAAELIALTAYAWLGGLIMIIFAIIFLLRYIALWLLVILSPLAFVCYVLPATKKFFTLWWNQFLQWNIIGISAAFFLFLGNRLFDEMVQKKTVTLAPSGLTFFDELLPYFVVITCLYLGLFVGLATGAYGASSIIGFARREGLKGIWVTQKWTGKQARRAARRLGETRAGQKVTAAAQKLATMPTPGATIPGWKGAALRMATGPFWALGRMTGRAGLSFLEAGKKKIEEAEKEVEKASVEMTVSKFKKSGVDWATKIGYLNRLIKQGDIDEALEKGLTRKEIVQTIEKAKQYDAHKDIISAVPHLFREEIGIKALQRGKSIAETYAEEIISKIRPQRAGQISLETLDDQDIMEAIARSWDGRHIAKLIETHGKTAAEKLESAIKRAAAAVNVSPDVWFTDPSYANNPRLLQYMKTSPAARGFFTI